MRNVLNLDITERSCWLLRNIDEEPVTITEFKVDETFLYFKYEGGKVHWRLPLREKGERRSVFAPNGFELDTPAEAYIGLQKYYRSEDGELKWIVFDMGWYKGLPIVHDGLSRVACLPCHSISAASRMKRCIYRGSDAKSVGLGIENRPVLAKDLKRVKVTSLCVDPLPCEVYFQVGDGRTYHLPLVVLQNTRRFWVQDGCLPELPCDALLGTSDDGLPEFLVIDPEWFLSLPQKGTFDA